jgi:hypothetical protein
LEELLGRVRRIEARAKNSEAEFADAIVPADLFRGKDVSLLLSRLDALGKRDDENGGLWSQSYLRLAATN